MAVLTCDSLSIWEQGNKIIDELSWTVHEGEQWAIVGPSGTGKTILLHALAGRHSYTGQLSFGAGVRKMVLVEQQHRFKNLSNTNTFYYQQRFNASDAEDSGTVEEDLLHCLEPEGENTLTAEAIRIVELLQIQSLLPVKLIQLSNGENKRLQIAKALLLKPALLLLDNPLTGLDVNARETLTAIMETLICQGIQIILVTGQHQLPAIITHVLSVERDGNYLQSGRQDYLSSHPSKASFGLYEPDPALLGAIASGSGQNDFESAVRMSNVVIQYNNRIILNKISWEVLKGERWSLSGPNGSGKSTLLSLINADNPQAYANDIYLFDRKRGSGESIWDIKKKIGFVSPELHLYFETGINCFDVVASGLFDTIGLFRILNETQEALVSNCMKLLAIEHLSKKFLYQLSNSEQRLVLLARALVKDPPLLILDEPSQGLDESQVELFRNMVNRICLLTGKTLIYVSHYPQEIPDCVDRFIRLENGRIVSGEQ